MKKNEDDKNIIKYDIKDLDKAAEFLEVKKVYGEFYRVRIKGQYFYFDNPIFGSNNQEDVDCKSKGEFEKMLENMLEQEGLKGAKPKIPQNKKNDDEMFKF